MKKFLYFSAAWCGPCRQLGPVMEQLSSQYPVRKIDVDTNQLLAQQYNIRNIPTVLLVDDDGDVNCLLEQVLKYLLWLVL